MISDGNRAWRRLGLFAAVCLIIALGESRPAISASGSEVPVVETVAMMAVGSDADGASQSDPSAAGSSDAAQLVPAIYAWDPDVQFVYFRHVSKWM